MVEVRGYTKVARAAAEERTRAALLDAAETLFFERGWAAMSLEGVAAGAGVTKQTLLRHFGSKEGLLAQAFARGFESVREQRWAVPGDSLEAAVENLLDHYEAVGDRALQIEAMAGLAAIAPWVQRGRELHYEWVDRAFAAFAPGRRERAALIALCDVHAWRVLRRHLGMNRAETHETLVLAAKGVLG